MGAPAAGWCAPFLCAAVEDTDAATWVDVLVLRSFVRLFDYLGYQDGGRKRTWDSQIELVGSEITTRVCSLDDQRLAYRGTGCEFESVAGRAPRRLGTTSNIDGCESVREGRVDGPWGLVSTHVCRPTAASRCSRVVCEWGVLDIAGRYWSRDIGFA